MKSAALAPRIALIGAGSLIGEAILAELRLRKLAGGALHALDDARDLGRPLEIDGEPVAVRDVAGFDFSQADIAFFCSRSAVSQTYAQAAAAHAWVIDGSSAFRGRLDVPLIAADVNPDALREVGAHGLIALPGSASVALATVLAPLHALAGLERVEVATYHAVSGSGRKAVAGLAAEAAQLLSGRPGRSASSVRQMAFNVVPLVDTLDADGVSAEERRLQAETRRVLGLADLPINATAVRVPVFFGHGLAVHLRTARALTAAAAAAALQCSSGVTVVDAQSGDPLPTPAMAALGPDRVYVGRLRADTSRDRSLNFWVVADNVRKCAAHNAVSVAQILVNRSQ
ncbi:MAG TPA: aspartate-semialdehyde dehydrogenase [Steroidobacteraceae bacterium]|nr:aspartate-semialdehyde dehydrogenase [Steroidobacteraceae bacterium]